MWLWRVSLQGAAAALLVSAAIVGWQSTATGQVELYECLLRAQDGVLARIPEFVVGPKGGLDAPIPLLVDAVVSDIVAETVRAESMRPRLALVDAQRSALDAQHTWLVTTETNLRLMRRLLDEPDSAAPTRTGPSRWWSWVLGESERPPLGPLERERLRHSPTVLAALPGLPVPIGDLNATFTTLDELPGLSELLRVLLKLAAVTPLRAAADAQLRAHLHHSTFEAMKQQWVQTEDRFDTLVRLGEELVSQCRVRCGELQGFATSLKQFLIQCTFHGFAVPPGVLVQLMEAAAFQSVTRVRTLTARDVRRALRVDAVRRAPNPWISAAGCAVAIPAVLFVCSVVTQLAWIVQVGILGTLTNVIAIAYEASARARLRLREPEGLNKLDDVQTRDGGSRQLTNRGRVRETDGTPGHAGFRSACD